MVWVASVALVAGCTAPHVPARISPPPSGTAASVPASPASVGTAVTVIGASVIVYIGPGGSVASTLQNPQPSGAPLVFLLRAQQGSWLQVDLDQRPNGSTGWIKRSAVNLSTLSYRLQVSTKANTVSLYQNTTLVKTFPAATGTGGTPTPHGSFYLTELLAPTNLGYGPYAFGVSAFSDALSSFGGGPGQIGLHGTDNVASIGQSASHGCIRLNNADITTLAKLLPLGTPITVGE